MDRVIKNVYTIDCDDLNTRYDPPKGHTYFLTDRRKSPGVIFEHIYEVIQKGRVFPSEEKRRTVILR